MRKVAKTTTHLTHKFFSDEFLRDYVAMIPVGGRFLQYSYARNRTRQLEGVDSQIQCEAERACSYWWRETTLPLLNSVNSYAHVGKFGLLPKQAKAVNYDSELPWVKEQLAKANRYDMYTVCLASQDAWNYSCNYWFFRAFSVQDSSLLDLAFLTILM